MSTLIELELTNEVPVFLGSYDTEFHTWDAFRTQSLKGLWRWWFRAYVMGILYENNLLKTRPGRRTLVELDKTCIDNITKLVGNLLGNTDQASRFRISISINRVGRERSCPGYDPYCMTHRIKLLTLGGRKITYTDLLSVKLMIEERLSFKKLSNDELLLGIGSLLTALILNGIGKMGRRGIGTFNIRLIRDHTGLFRKYFRRDGSLDLDRAPELIREVRKACNEYVSKFLTLKHSVSSLNIPPYDLISEHKVNVENVTFDFDQFEKPEFLKDSTIPVFMIYEVKWSGKRMNDVATELVDFFYRPGRIRRYFGGPNTPYGSWHDFLTIKKHCWFFGLPREQRGTGYIVRDEVNRRASPIHLSIHKDRAYFTVFLSLDWPQSIDWIGAGSAQIIIDESRIIKAYVESLTYLQSYLKKLNYSFKVIFP